MNTQVMERPIIKTATVTVLYVNPAKAPHKSGSIKDTDGQFFSVWPNMLNQFEIGGTYDIEFTEKVANGTVYRDVKAVHPAVQPETFRAPAPRPQPQQQRSAPVQQHVTPPNSNGNGKGEYYKTTSPKDARRMFICSQINAMISARSIMLTEEGIAEAIRVVSAAYDQTIGLEDQ